MANKASRIGWWVAIGHAILGMSLVMYLLAAGQTGKWIGNLFPWPLVALYLLDLPAFAAVGWLYYQLFGSPVSDWVGLTLVIALSSALYGYIGAWICRLILRLQASRQ